MMATRTTAAEPGRPIPHPDSNATTPAIMMATPTTAAEPGSPMPRSQPTINIGVVGHVAHGKSTLVKALSGIATQKHKSELKQNITIKLGYANAKIYRGVPPRPGARPVFCSRGSDGPDTFVSEDGTTMVAVRHVSFVDCPGHEVLMATMLNGAAVMDAALLLVAANEPCPQPQTLEHLAALEVMQNKQLDVVILQNKVDLIGMRVTPPCAPMRPLCPPRSPLCPPVSTPGSSWVAFAPLSLVCSLDKKRRVVMRKKKKKRSRF